MFCTYCGFPANQRDHLNPKARNMGRSVGITVWACRECNVTLSDRPFFTIEDRAKFLLMFFIKRWGVDILEDQKKQYRLAHLAFIAFGDQLFKRKRQKLTLATICQIFLSTLPHSELEILYGVNKSTIWNIQNRVIYADFTMSLEKPKRPRRRKVGSTTPSSK